jgi:uncharacterized repeat protein (TIGR01451 family)
MRAFLARAVLAGAALFAVEARGTLTLTKIPNPPSVSAGDVASFVYVVQNGSSTSLSVSLVDTLPAGVTWSENSASCTMGSGRNLSCSFGTLGAGATRTVTVTGTTDFADCGTLSSTATAAGTTGGDQATAGVGVLCPDVKGVVVPDSIAWKEPFAFTFALRNDGAGIARSVQFTHAYVIAGLTWSLEPPDPLCTIGANSVTCAVGDLGPGAGHTSRLVSTSTTDSFCGIFEADMTITVANEPSPTCCPFFWVNPKLRKPGDATGNCVLDVADVFYLINYLFAGGPAPQP